MPNTSFRGQSKHKQPMIWLILTELNNTGQCTTQYYTTQ